MPTPLKDPAQRARRNKTGTEATLPPQTAARAPDLPERAAEDPWHPSVVEWWSVLSDSPISRLYTALDWQQALDLAQIRQMWAKAPSAKLYAMIQKASIGLGLDNADRRRNGWKMPVSPKAPEQLPALPQPERAARPRRVRDTRSVLRSVAGGKR